MHPVVELSGDLQNHPAIDTSQRDNAMSDSFATLSDLTVGDTTYRIHSLEKLGQRFDIKRLPYAMKILLENLLRNEDGVSVTADSIEAVATW